ncbi:MAG: hypothetical protein HOJ15_03615 [Candidatus Jacksonbacteria bacterium]|jgi:hypothetical protein|nr:hypothetical protein [Candidatus Jacksonbacteria bacterium]MBT6034701.1 hypothetical protein [Candidatus Jacksonbacteria bacterium]MBT6301487.1 hypothetical protein [Candidatus Jacksonbacteria bacterium]MBT6757538.1 hypothetical protein [Candidatus Jacksonbacteria bacterium]MBT6955063.1 hypothetical protein [Candidatus Jacksonbacteria bacterium]
MEFFQNSSPIVVLILIIVMAVIMVLKGLALWRAGNNVHKTWFIFMFIFNTAGILEIVYLLTAGKRAGTAPAPAQPTQPTQ